MVRTERVAIEKHTERRILECPMRPAFRQTRVFSPRQPRPITIAALTREYQSDQPSQKPRSLPALILQRENNHESNLKTE